MTGLCVFVFDWIVCAGQKSKCKYAFALSKCRHSKFDIFGPVFSISFTFSNILLDNVVILCVSAEHSDVVCVGLCVCVDMELISFLALFISLHHGKVMAACAFISIAIRWVFASSDIQHFVKPYRRNQFYSVHVACSPSPFPSRDQTPQNAYSKTTIYLSSNAGFVSCCIALHCIASHLQLVFRDFDDFRYAKTISENLKYRDKEKKWAHTYTHTHSARQRFEPSCTVFGNYKLHIFHIYGRVTDLIIGIFGGNKRKTDIHTCTLFRLKQIRCQSELFNSAAVSYKNMHIAMVDASHRIAIV